MKVSARTAALTQFQSLWRSPTNISFVRATQCLRCCTTHKVKLVANNNSSGCGSWQWQQQQKHQTKKAQYSHESLTLLRCLTSWLCKRNINKTQSTNIAVHCTANLTDEAEECEALKALHHNKLLPMMTMMVHATTPPLRGKSLPHTNYMQLRKVCAAVNPFTLKIFLRETIKIFTLRNFVICRNALKRNPLQRV